MIVRVTFVLLCLCLPLNAGLTIGPDGWSVATPSADSRLIHVSNSEGDDDNDGSQTMPVKTLAEGYRRLRTGYPDWLLIKRGDTFTDESWEVCDKSGRSEQERLVITSYGDPTLDRPLLRKGGTIVRNERSGPPTDHFLISGLRFYNHKADPYSPDFDPDADAGSGFRWRETGSNFRIENCDIQGFSIGLELTNRDYSRLLSNVEVRRCSLFRNRGQGMLITGIDGLEFFECFFDHNGWYNRSTDPRYGGSTKKHGCYLENLQVFNAKFSKCIVARASSHGIHFRPGGIIEGCLFVQNPISIEVGYPNNKDDPNSVHDVVVEIRDNVIEGGSDINDKALRGSGIILKDTSSAKVTNNLIYAVISSETNTYGIQVSDFYGKPALGVELRGNMTHEWERGDVRNDADLPVVETGNSWWDARNPIKAGNQATETLNLVDSHRDVGKYHRTQCKVVPNRPWIAVGRHGTAEAFLLEARARWNKRDWDPDYHTENVTAWIKAGFEIDQD